MSKCACYPITGGIAEAFYGGVPDLMAERTKKCFPKIFNEILDEMKTRTAYGKPFPISRG